jgi:hypothetical protein
VEIWALFEASSLHAFENELRVQGPASQQTVAATMGYFMPKQPEGFDAFLSRQD